MRSGEYKKGDEDGKVWGGVWTASDGLSTAADSNEGNYHSNNISLSEGMEEKDKWLCWCVCGWVYTRVCVHAAAGCVCACMVRSISLVVSLSFPESQYLFVSPQ